MPHVSVSVNGFPGTGSPISAGRSRVRPKALIVKRMVVPAPRRD